MLTVIMSTVTSDTTTDKSFTELSDRNIYNSFAAGDLGEEVFSCTRSW